MKPYSPSKASCRLGLGVPGPGRVLGWLAPAGRMALTNYLLQSVVAAIAFHGYGFALWGQLGRAAQVALVFAVFAAQVVLSALWLSRFRFGPVEWLWRWLTYGTRPPMRQAGAEWRQRVEKAGGRWRMINDLERLDGLL